MVCKVREKELREKDILIQDNLIRFSSFLSQQDTRKTKDLDAANVERAKIEEKNREIEAAETKYEALKRQHNRIEAKMLKLQQFEDFLKEVQSRYADEFTALDEIETRYARLSDTNALLVERHNSSGGQTDEIISRMENYKREAGTKTLSYTNRIAEEQRQLQEIEGQKAALMIGNEEATEQLLKQTSEHGTILMSIDALFRKIAIKNNQNNHEVHFIWHKQVAGGKDETPTVFKQDQCLEQLDVIKAYIEGFDMFKDRLNEQVETTDPRAQKTKMSYFQRMQNALATNDATKDEIGDFNVFDPLAGAR